MTHLNAKVSKDSAHHVINQKEFQDVTVRLRAQLCLNVKDRERTERKYNKIRNYLDNKTSKSID
jgi:hypothetical protein